MRRCCPRLPLPGCARWSSPSVSSLGPLVSRTLQRLLQSFFGCSLRGLLWSREGVLGARHRSASEEEWSSLSSRTAAGDDFAIGRHRHHRTSWPGTRSGRGFVGARASRAACRAAAGLRLRSALCAGLRRDGRCGRPLGGLKRCRRPQALPRAVAAACWLVTTVGICLALGVATASRPRPKQPSPR